METVLCTLDKPGTSSMNYDAKNTFLCMESMPEKFNHDHPSNGWFSVSGISIFRNTKNQCLQLAKAINKIKQGISPALF